MIGVDSLSSFGCQSWWRSAVSHPAVCLMCCAVVWCSEMFSCSGSVMAGAVGVVLPADEDCLCVSGCTAYWVPTVMGKLEITLNYGIVISRPWKVMRMSAGYGYIFFLVMLSFRIGKNGASCHTRSSLYVCVFLCHWFISWFQMPSSKPSFKWNIFVNSVITSYFLIII